MTKRSILIVPYTLLILSLLSFLLYFLTLRPGGAGGNIVVVWVLTAFASGGMIMMAIYGFTLYMFRSGEKAALYFSLLCLSASVRFFVLDGSETIRGFIPAFPANVTLFIDYICLALMIVLLHRFWYELFVKPRLKRTMFVIEVCMLIGLIISNIINVLLGYNIVILHSGFVFLSLIMMAHIAVEVYRSPKFKKNPLNWLYFISLLIYIIMPVIVGFFTHILPNVPILSNMMMVIIHVILLSERYSRTINDNELLDRLNRTRSELFATISHNMKTPLTIIATDIQLANKFTDENQIEKANFLLQEAWQETMKLADQITGAISISRSNEFIKEKSFIDFAEVIEPALYSYEQLIKKQGNTLLWNIEKVPKIFSNADMLTTLLINLLENANRHTKNGYIKAHLSQVEDGMCCLEISDNGEGIEAELLPRVFERGVSGSDSSGLGLSIVKSIMELHNGKVDLESEVGKGTTVKLYFKEFNHKPYE